MNDPKSDAALYLLSGLIQRIAKDKPDLIDEMLSGIKSDQASISDDVNEKDHIDNIFKECISVLERVKALSGKNA